MLNLPQESLASPLLELLRTRARHASAQRTASNRLIALQHLQTRVRTLQHAEEQLSAARGQIDAVLELRNGGTEVGGTAVEVQLKTREKKVVAAAEAQLQDAFERAVRAVGDETNGELRLQSEVALRVLSCEWCFDIACSASDLAQCPINRATHPHIIRTLYRYKTSCRRFTPSVCSCRY